MSTNLEKGNPWASKSRPSLLCSSTLMSHYVHMPVGAFVNQDSDPKVDLFPRQCREAVEGLVIFMIGMALPLITEDFTLSAAEAGLVTATSLVGILLGALLLGHLSDELGRRKMFIAEMVLFTIFLAGFTISPSLPVLLACLLGMGMALGCDVPPPLTSCCLRPCRHLPGHAPSSAHLHSRLSVRW